MEFVCLFGNVMTMDQTRDIPNLFEDKAKAGGQILI
jgi:hypothetical protein